MRRLSVRAFLLLGVLFLAIPHASADSELLRLGRELLDEGQFEKAVLPLTTALERDGDNPLLRYLLGRAYYEQRPRNQEAGALHSGPPPSPHRPRDRAGHDPSPN